MMHRYQVGQILEMRSSPHTSNRPAGPCEVLFCLPHERGPVLYRVKSLNEKTERVVDEIDLTLSEAIRAAAVQGSAPLSIKIGRR